MRQHDDEDQAGQEHYLLLNVHWREWVLVELFRIDILHLADVRTQDEFDEEQEDDEQEQRHDQVVSDVAEVVDGDASRFGERPGDDQCSPFKWEHWLAESRCQVDTEDRSPEDRVALFDTKFSHRFHHQWPEDQE